MTVPTTSEKGVGLPEANGSKVIVEHKDDNDDTDNCCISCCRKRIDGYKADWNAVCDEVTNLKKEVQQRVHVRQMIRSWFSFAMLQSFFPILKWGRQYSLFKLQGDLISGIAVGLTILPQSLAYATIANLTGQFGLYSSFMGCFLYFCMGTAKDVNIGPTAVISLMTATYTAINVAKTTAADDKILQSEVYPVIATVLTIGSGLVLLGMFLLRAGFLVEYISHPVINSFTTAAGITIWCSQVKAWLGLKKIPRDFIKQAIQTLQKLPQTKIPDFVMGLICMIILYILKKIRDVKFCGKKPGPVLAKILWILSMSRNATVIICASGASYAFLKYHTAFKLTITGNLPPGIPQWKLPAFSIDAHLSRQNITMGFQDILSHIGPGFVLVPVISYIEIIAIAKAFGRKNGYYVDAGQELLTLGAVNFLSSFVSAYPTTASFSRSAVNMQSGVTTTAGNILTGVMVLIALQFLTGAFYYIPTAALAAVIMMAVTDIIDFSMLPKLWKVKKADILPWLVTFFVGLGVSIEYGLIAGVGMSLLLLLFPWARPAIEVESAGYDASLGHNIPSAADSFTSDIIIVRLNHGFRFPAADYVREKVVNAATAGGGKPRHVIFDCTQVAAADASTIHCFHDFGEEFAKLNTVICLSNVNKDIQAMLIADGVKSLHIYKDNDTAIAGIKKDDALEIVETDAMPLVNDREDVDPIEIDCTEVDPAIFDKIPKGEHSIHIDYNHREKNNDVGFTKL